MKILVVQDRLRSGGTERQSIFLANAFAAAGHPTTLLTFRPGGQLAGTVATAVDRRVLQSSDLGLDWFAPGLSRTVANVAPDIVLCMGRMANCWGFALQRRLARCQPKAAVLGTMRTGKHLPWLFRRSLRSCRHIVANSRDARETLVRQYGLPESKIDVIYNSLVFRPAAESDGRRSPAAERLRAQQGATPATQVMLCVAMFRPEKNQRALIEIVQGLPASAPWQLWLAGAGPAKAACEQLVATHGLQDRVKFLGFHRDPTDLYAAADLAVHASWSEALSNFLIEAQAHGLPVVAYAAQGIGECFVPGATGWEIPRDNREGFRTALDRLFAASPEDRAARSTHARTFARTTFDPARQVSAYLDLFHQILR